MTTRARNGQIYGALPPWDVPAYTLTAAATLVRVPVATLRTWVHGRDYPAGGGMRRSQPLIVTPPRSRHLSFTNLVEAHVLAAMRKRFELPMTTVRRALTFVERELGVRHPLATEPFRTDGVDLFVERLDALIVASAEGQAAIRDAIEAGLQRIGYEGGHALQFFPFVRADERAAQPKVVVMDPRIAFGRPVVVGTGIPVEEIAQRFHAGEAADALATDFRIRKEMVEDAVRAWRAAA